MAQADYPTLFRGYIARRIQQVQHVVATEEFVHSRPKQEQALRVLDYALVDPPDPDAVSALLIAMAPAMEQAGHSEAWRAYLLQGIRLSRRVGDVATEAELAFHIGILFQRQSQFTEAHSWLRTSTNLFAEIDLTTGQARTLNQLAFVEYLRHDYDQANQRAEQAILLAGTDQKLQAMTHFLKGSIAMAHGHWVEAEAWYRHSLALRQATGDQRRTAWSLMDLANALRRQQRFNEAINYYLQSAEILASLDDRYFWSHVQMNLGLAYFHNNEVASALRCYQLAQTNWQTYNDLLNLAKLKTNMGLAYLALDDPALAEDAFSGSINFYQRLEDDAGALNSTDGLAMALLAQQRYPDAITKLNCALREISKIADLPLYNYLLNSMTTHLVEAQQGLATKI